MRAPRSTASVCACALVAFGQFLITAPALADAVVFVLRRVDGKMVVEKDVVADGTTRTWKLGQDGFVDLITTTGPGGSGSVVQAASSPTVEATCTGHTLKVATIAAGGARYERQVAGADELATLDVRISARGSDGGSYRGFIRGNDRVESDTIGPVEDIFGGKVPLNEGDCSIYTSTFESRTQGRASLTGSAPLRMVKGHHVAPAKCGGASGDVVIDLAAGTTILLRSALPEGTKIEESVMTQYSPQGVKRLAAEVGGATGSAMPVGVAVVPDLVVGDVHFKDASVLVMDELPPVSDGKLIGIVGIDLVARASSVTFEKRTEGGLSLELGAANAAAPHATLPLALIGDRAYAGAVFNGVQVCMVVDTGSPFTILDGPAAKAASIAAAKEGEAVRGVGTKKAPLSIASAASLVLGDIELKDVEVRTGSLPIFATLRAGNPVGILGTDVLSRFSRMRLDFDSRELLLWR